MQVQVLFFGVLKDLAGRSSDVLSLPDHARAGDVVSHYKESLVSAKGIFDSIAISVNQEYANPEDCLRAGDEVALLPPVSGGATDRAPRVNEIARVFLTDGKINTQATLESIKHFEDGAVVVFEGVVRNHTRGRRTLFLEYEAYEPMARKQMESLIVEAIERFQIRDAIIIHRLGQVEVGETSVTIMVASAHRAAAFDACRFLIDALKRTVPIWKKEHFEQDVVWCDGEPFPQERSARTEVERGAPVAENKQPGVPTEVPGPGSHSEDCASNPINLK
jgi:MoaE-MoaD fusion protein